MEKNTSIIKKLLVVAIILTVVTISIISFVGVYTKNLNRMSNAIPNYVFSTEFEGNREYRFALDTSEEEKEVYVDSNGIIKGEVISKEDSSTEVEVTGEDESTEVEKEDTKTEIEGYTIEKRIIKSNDDSVLTKDSYKKSKEIIEKRLETLGVAQYNVRLDEVNGKILVELPDDSDVNFLYEVISSKGEFKIIDSQTGLELMNNSNIKTVDYGYNTTNGTYTVYLQIAFNKEGTQILKDMSNTYVEKTVEKVENSEESDTQETDSEESSDKETKYVEIKLDNSTIMKTYFAEEMPGGYIQIPLNQNIKTVDELQKALKSASAISVLLSSGNMPNSYLLENDDFVKSAISEDTINNVKIVFMAILIIISVVLLIKFGLNGLLGAILNIGYVGLVLLAIRYTNVIITISSVIALFGIILINSVFMYILLKNLKEQENSSKAYLESMKKIYLSIIPICIVAFVFTFMTNASVVGIGSILFWGIIVQSLYSLIFVRSVYILKD